MELTVAMLQDRPAATAVQGEGWFNRLFDLLARTSYAGANALQAIVQGRLADVPEAYRKGLTGEVKGAGRDVAAALGLSTEGPTLQIPGLTQTTFSLVPYAPAGPNPWLPQPPAPPATEQAGLPVEVSPAGAVGLAIDLLNPFDPLNWGLQVGKLGRAGRIAEAITSAEQAGILEAGSKLARQAEALQAAGRSTELGRTVAEQAARRQRNILNVTLPGLGAVGPSDLPGAAGRLAARVQEPFFRLLDTGREWLLSQRPIQDLIGLVSTAPLTPAKKAERILQERDRVARYLVWKAQLEKKQLSDEIADLAEQLGVEQDAIKKQITEAAQRIQATEGLQPEVAEIARRVQTRQPERLRAEQALGVPTPEFQSQRIRYLHREPTEEFRAWLDQQRSQRQPFGRRGDVSLLAGPQVGRVIEPEATIAEINKAALEGRTAWAPTGSWTTYTIRQGDTLSEIAQKTGTTVEELAKRNGIENPDVLRVGQRIEVPEMGIRITKEPQANPALPKIPIFTEDPAVIELAREIDFIRTTTSAEALDRVIQRGLEEGWVVEAPKGRELPPGWQRVDLPRFAGKLEGYAFPSDAADVLKAYMRKWEDTEGRNALLRAMGAFNNWWRNQTLFPIPAYHARNFLTGLWKNYLADMNPLTYRDGIVFAEIRGGLSQPESLRFVAANGKVWTGAEVLDEYMKQGLGTGFMEQFDQRFATSSLTSDSLQAL
ncbi:LysM peptidoglycan-binding domain-containing protein [Geochorda subterranea]|uniref:LysM peptidoglycan-binding domain-containing protein n=1 Tax=Geochorda subterranea TaxID=3109564 RepID=A0ABZ1BP32_9FIRM|nr:LysM peptidoglycan-binding domain-containing protein [Limnochorda sp. LNt]WRP14590.1 LysM peptidoglycan-binding domain-containing protein [Limnochorda sp. LNt]